MFKIFPSQYYFDSEDELKFLAWTFEKTKTFIIIIGLIVPAFLVFITACDCIEIGYEIVYKKVFYLRVLMAIVTLGVTLSFMWFNPKDSQRILFGVLLFLICLVVYDIYTMVKVSGRFDPAGYMFALYLFMVVPYINVEHKFTLGMVYVLGLLYSKLMLSVSDFAWTFAYVIVVYIVSLIVCYRFDLLFRAQFKSVLDEKKKACIDPLTGAYNRKALHSFFKEDLMVVCNGRKMIVGILDIDCFKLYNDTYGHLEGDKVLRKFANALVSIGFDKVYRFGGEEFIFTWNVPDNKDFTMPDICNVLESFKIPHKASTVNSFVTASVGVVIIAYEEICDNDINDSFADFLIMKADDNLYKAKKSGRNNAIISSKTDLLEKESLCMV